MPRRRLVYAEGDWFGVPLADGRWAVGRVARMHRTGKILFAYCFGPYRDLPDLPELDQLHPSRAVLIRKVGDIGLQEGRWPILGRGTWVRDDWPLVPLRNVDPILGRVRRVEYAEGDLLTSVWRVVDDPMTDAPADGLDGHLALEIRLSKLLAAS